MWNIPIGSAWDLFIDLHRTQGRLASGIDLRLREWDLAVAEYTGRKLSKTFDKLVAISGLANQVMARLKLLEVEDTYAAGLWACALPCGLLWESVLPNYPHPKDYRAPSWSWAAKDGPVYLRTSLLLADEEELVWEVRITTTTLHTSSTGQVIDGELTLSGRLAAPMFSPYCIQPPSCKRVQVSMLRNIESDAHIAVREGYICFDHSDISATSSELFCLPIIDGRNECYMSLVQDGKRVVSGIVLNQERSAEFSRVGFL